MSLDPPKVLLEQSFLLALTDPMHEHHQTAVASYLELLDQYEREAVLLVTVSDHLRPWQPGRRHGVLAPVDVLHVGRQHRRVARRMVAEPDFDVALSLTMCEREKVQRIATFDSRFRSYAVACMPD